MTNKKDLKQAKRFILSGIRKQESELKKLREYNELYESNLNTNKDDYRKAINNCIEYDNRS